MFYVSDKICIPCKKVQSNFEELRAYNAIKQSQGPLYEHLLKSKVVTEWSDEVGGGEVEDETEGD